MGIIRQKRKELERLPDLQKVECVTISIGTFKQ